MKITIKAFNIADPLSRYPRHRRLRSSWLGSVPAVGCRVTEDMPWGFGHGHTLEIIETLTTN